MTYRRLLPLVFTLCALLLAAVPASAQAPQSTLNLNAYHCPAGYDEISDCSKLADVYVDVSQDGQPVGQVRTSSTEPATMDLQEGASIELTIAGGVPERADLESDLDLSFTAVAGENPVMLVFVDQEEVPAPHTDANALVVEALLCPVDYAGNNYERDCTGEGEIGVTVTRDADDFSATGVTGADGIIGFQGLGEGTYTVELGVPGDAADFLTFCGTPDAVEPRELSNPDTNRIGVYLGPTETLTCTFFIVPADVDAEPAPAPTKPTTSPPVTKLPSTGVGETTSVESGLNASSLMLGASLLLAAAGIGVLHRQRS